MQDFSFLRLKPTFAEAKQMGDQKQSDPTLRGYDCIKLHPLETYLQISNSEVDIVFDNDYKVTIIDCSEVELLDITSNVTIYEGVNQVTEIQNIAFEIVKINQSFADKVFLKFEHTTGTEVFYSNAFWVTEYGVEDTVRLDYSCIGYYEGVDYENFPYIQSIRVSGRIEEPQDETENSKYVQQSGNTVSKRNIYVESEDVVFDLLNPFTYRRIARALKSDFVYLDGFRSTDLPVLKNGEREGSTNLATAESTIYRDFDDKVSDAFQLFAAFDYIELFPTGLINEEVINTQEIRIVFNKPVNISETGLLRIHKANGVVVAGFNYIDLELDGANTVKGTSLLMDQVVIGLDYYVTFDAGLFTSDLGETVSITDNTEWTFTTVVGFYDEEYYSTNYYLT